MILIQHCFNKIGVYFMVILVKNYNPQKTQKLYENLFAYEQYNILFIVYLSLFALFFMTSIKY